MRRLRCTASVKIQWKGILVRHVAQVLGLPGEHYSKSTGSGHPDHIGSALASPLHGRRDLDDLDTWTLIVLAAPLLAESTSSVDVSSVTLGLFCVR